MSPRVLVLPVRRPPPQVWDIGRESDEFDELEFRRLLQQQQLEDDRPTMTILGLIYLLCAIVASWLPILALGWWWWS